jgi:hypothetical protein
MLPIFYISIGNVIYSYSPHVHYSYMKLKYNIQYLQTYTNSFYLIYLFIYLREFVFVYLRVCARACLFMNVSVSNALTWILLW